MMFLKNKNNNNWAEDCRSESKVNELALYALRIQHKQMCRTREKNPTRIRVFAVFPYTRNFKKYGTSFLNFWYTGLYIYKKIFTVRITS